MTLGNHTWARDGMGPYLAKSERVIRPANFAAGTPGRGLAVVEAADGTPVAVCNVLGQLFLEVSVSPFEVLDGLVEEARSRAPVVLVDFHAEATSEKIAVARLLDGRVTASSARTRTSRPRTRASSPGEPRHHRRRHDGPHDSVIGVEADLAIQRMRTGIPVRFRPAPAACGWRVSCSTATLLRVAPRPSSRSESTSASA